MEGRINLLIKTACWSFDRAGLAVFVHGRSFGLLGGGGDPRGDFGHLCRHAGPGPDDQYDLLVRRPLSLGVDCDDDAIVVAEHGDALNRKGMPAGAAQCAGGHPHVGACLASSLTTIAAFAPLFILSGKWGAFCSGLSSGGYCRHLSLFDRMFFDPAWPYEAALKRARAGGSLGWAAQSPTAIPAPAWMRAWTWCVNGPLAHAVRAAVAYRYVVILAGFAIMWMAYQLLFSGRGTAI